MENSGSGSLKLSVQYASGVLSVLILHAQSLALTPQGLPPNPYVKVHNTFVEDRRCCSGARNVELKKTTCFLLSETLLIK